MRQLRFLKQADDSNHVIVEIADGSEQFVLLIDSRLRDAARSDLPRLTPSQPAPEPKIGPREIQMRVRAGETPEALAEQSGMSVDRVMRFAGAVLEERDRIADEARRARARRAPPEGQSVIFGEAVDERFAAHGINPQEVGWDARRREDGQWVITASWHGGDSQWSAQWQLHLASRQVTPLDETATDLLSDRPVRALVPPPPPQPPRKAVTDATPPLAQGVVAFPAMPNAKTAPMPVLDDVFDQEAPARGPRRHDATARARIARGLDIAPPAHTELAPAEPAPATDDAAGPDDADLNDTLLDDALLDDALLDEALLNEANVDDAELDGADFDKHNRHNAMPGESESESDEQPLPLHVAGTPEPRNDRHAARVTNLGIAHRGHKADESKADRARIPSWDDILLGVRRKND